MKIPNNIKICGHTYKIIETDDTALLDGDSWGRWDSYNHTIHMKKSVPQTLKEETLLHEIGEVLLRTILSIRKDEFNHSNWERFSNLLYSTLKENNINFKDK